MRCAFFLLATTVAADYLLISQFLSVDCSGPVFQSQAAYLQPCTQTGGSPASISYTFINSTAYTVNAFASINCTGSPLSSTPTCVQGGRARSSTRRPTNILPPPPRRRTQDNGACVSNSTWTFVQGAYQRAPTGYFQSAFAYNAGNASTWNTCPFPFTALPLLFEVTVSFNCATPGPYNAPSGRYFCNSTSVFVESYDAPNCAGNVNAVASVLPLGCVNGFNLSCALFVLQRFVPPLPSAFPSLNQPLPPRRRPAASASPTPSPTPSGTQSGTQSLGGSSSASPTASSSPSGTSSLSASAGGSQQVTRTPTGSGTTSPSPSTQSGGGGGANAAPQSVPVGAAVGGTLGGVVVLGVAVCWFLRYRAVASASEMKPLVGTGFASR